MQVMTNTKPPVMPESRPSMIDWMKEFRVGIMAKKVDRRASEIMKLWGQNGQPADFTEVINRLKVS